MSDIKKFNLERTKRVSKYNTNSKIYKSAFNFFKISSKNKYTYNFDWLGMPIIQYPEDIITIQEIIYRTQPNVIIETGIARGGSLILHSSLLHMIQKNSHVIGIDVDIRKHNRKKIERHFFYKNISMVEGDSTSEKTITEVKRILKKLKFSKKIMVCLDSKHTHDHVLNELKQYSKFVSKNCYIVVFDTTINFLSSNEIKKLSKNYIFKPFEKNSNPHSAVKKFLKENKNFKIDNYLHQKALISNCYEGFIKKVK